MSFSRQALENIDALDELAEDYRILLSGSGKEILTQNPFISQLVDRFKALKSTFIHLLSFDVMDQFFTVSEEKSSVQGEVLALITELQSRLKIIKTDNPLFQKMTERGLYELAETKTFVMSDLENIVKEKGSEDYNQLSTLIVGEVMDRV